MNHAIPETSAKALNDALKSATPPVVIDVREAWEVAQGALPGVVHMPLGSLGDTAAGTNGLPEDRSQSIVTYCHHGMRSLRAAEALLAKGYTQVASLEGGIDSWAQAVDASVGRY